MMWVRSGRFIRSLPRIGGIGRIIYTANEAEVLSIVDSTDPDNDEKTDRIDIYNRSLNSQGYVEV